MDFDVKALKPVKKGRRGSKAEREMSVLVGLVELYIKEGVPVGSNTLRDAGFQEFSSATLRNYFVSLERDGYLMQQHTSGGRIPTPKAYRAYAAHCLEERARATLGLLNDEYATTVEQLRTSGSNEIGTFLEHGAEVLSDLAKGAVFLSAPRFDHDFVRDLKLVTIDQQRCLCVIVTSFGIVKTEVLRSDIKLSAFALKRIEAYFHWRLTGQDKPEDLSDEEHDLAQRFYNEALVRYVVGYSNFVDEEIFRTGFSQLLQYPDYADVASLAGSLSLFESPHAMRLLLRECSSAQEIKTWVGDELPQHCVGNSNCAVIAIPYKIGPKVVGAIGLLGPMRMPYAQVFELMQHVADAISEALTNSVYRFGITYRQPLHQAPSLEQEQQLLLEDRTHDK